jgi:predicted transcriptional regulator
MPFAFKQILEKIASEKAPGPTPSFTVIHLLLAMELVAKKETGRGKLAENLGVGEGTIRTILGRLKDAGVVEISKAGCSLTDSGLRLWKEYTSAFNKIQIGQNELALAKYNFAVLVRNCAEAVGSGIEQRDAAVMAGARSATTIMVRKKRMAIPSVSQDVVRDFPVAADQLVRLLHPKENDVIVIGGSDNSRKAEYGALAAAWTLLGRC